MVASISKRFSVLREMKPKIIRACSVGVLIYTACSQPYSKPFCTIVRRVHTLSSLSAKSQKVVCTSWSPLSSKVASKVPAGSGKVPARFQQRSTNVPARFQARFQQGFQEGSCKVPARLQARFQQGSSKVPGRFQQGSSKVPARFQEGSSKVPARFQQGSSKVPARFQQGSSKVSGRFQESARFQEGSSKVPGRLQQGSSKVPARFQQGSSKVPARFQQGFRKVPGRLQQGSSKVPGLFRFFEACIFVAPLPGPTDRNPTLSLLGTIHYKKKHGFRTIEFCYLASLVKPGTTHSGSCPEKWKRLAKQNLAMGQTLVGFMNTQQLVYGT